MVQIFKIMVSLSSFKINLGIWVCTIPCKNSFKFINNKYFKREKYIKMTINIKRNEIIFKGRLIKYIKKF